MQYTPSPLPLSGRPVPAPALSPDRFLSSVTLALPAGPCRVPLRDVPALFATIPDPRRAQRREFPLAAILAATFAALLAHHLSQLAASEWLAAQGPAIQRALGFRPGRTPHPSTFNRVLRRVAPTYLAHALQQFLDPPPDTPAPAAAKA